MSRLTNRTPQSIASAPTPAQFPMVPMATLKTWWGEVTRALTERQLSDSVNQRDLAARITEETNIRISEDEVLAQRIESVVVDYEAADAVLSAAIVSEATARANADTALASSITAVTAIANSKAKITVSGSAPSSPSTNDLWIDTSDNNKAKYWDGAAWQYKQDLVLAASVTTEATARASADGNLSGKYTLTVAAGNVVTGMNITSSSGPGTNISDVTFVASNFKIYNGTTGLTMFSVSSSDVKLGNVLTVNTGGSKVYIGAGNFNNADTGFYVDASGQFSLKDKLSWNGTTLSINGNITSTSGTIGGFTLGATQFSAGSGDSFIRLSAGGLIELGTNSNTNYYTQIGSTALSVRSNGGGSGTWAAMNQAGSIYCGTWSWTGSVYSYVSQVWLDGSNGNIEFAGNLYGAEIYPNPGYSYAYKFTIETNPSNADHCNFGAATFVGSDGFEYWQVNINGNTSRYVRLYGAVP